VAMPGFAANAALYSQTDHYKKSVDLRALTEGHGTSASIVVALPPRDSEGPTDRRADCVESCRQLGLSATECSRRCNPTLGSTYQCKMQDNTVNHVLCHGGVYAWEGACLAECALLNGVPAIGPALAAGCSAGCNRLGNQMRSTCPPSTICV
jgi:hypothetical protein